MKTIENTAELATAFEIFNPDADGAFATGRVLDGQCLQENYQEWAERGTINGSPAVVYYLFENTECQDVDAGDYPFDMDHVDRINIAERDSDGDFEAI